MNNRNTLFLDGIFRSGTTFFSRILDAFPNSYVLDDPISFFHHYIMMKERRWSLPNPKDMIKRREIDLISFPADPGALKENLAIYVKRIEALDDNLRADLLRCIEQINNKMSFIEIFSNIISTMRLHSSASLVGIKATFHHRFREAILDAMPDMKWVTIVRDPRAIYNSSKVSHGEDISFMCKCWNSLIDSFSEVKPEQRERFLVIRYEDLVLKPNITISRVAKFLNVNIDIDGFIKNLQLKDNVGSTWFSNSSYKEDGSSWMNAGVKSQSYFYKKSIDKWEKMLSLAEKRVIYKLCMNNMEKMGYEPSNERKSYGEEARDSILWLFQPRTMKSCLKFLLNI